MEDLTEWIRKNPALATAIGGAVVLLILYYYGYFSKSTAATGNTQSGNLASYYAAESASTNSSAGIERASIDAGAATDLAQINQGTILGEGAQTTTQQFNQEYQSGLWSLNAGFWSNDQAATEAQSLAQSTGANPIEAAVIASSVKQPYPTGTFI